MTSKFNVTIQSDSLNESLGIEGESFYIGRSDQADITVKNSLLSRKHVKIKYNNSQLSIQDLDTTNGTVLNDQVLVPHEWYEFCEDDLIKIGKGEISINIKVLPSNENKSKIIDLKQYSDDLTIENNKQIKNFSQITSNMGNLAIKDEYHHDVAAIVSRVDQSPKSEFSEIELLEIKKIEIETQVKALKIKEESEKEARRILEAAKQEANAIVNAAHEASVEIIDAAEDNSEKILADAKNESIKIFNETKTLCNEQTAELETKVSEFKIDIDNLKKEKTELSIKVEQVHSDISDSLKQKQGLELKCDSLKDTIVLSEKELSLLNEKTITVNDVLKNKEQIVEQLEFKVKRLERESEGLEHQRNYTDKAIEELKKKEFLIQENIEKNQQRLDKFFDIKEEISQENKKLENRLQSLNEQEQTLENKISQLEITLSSKQNELLRIEREVQDHIHEEKEKLKVELATQREIESEKWQKVKAENELLIKTTIEDAKEKSIQLEAQAKTQLENAQRIEASAKEYEYKIKNDLQLKIESINAEISKKREELSLEVKTSQEKALHEYQSTLVLAKDKARDITEKAQSDAQENLERAKSEAKEIVLESRMELENAHSKAVELVRLAQDKSAQIHADALKNLEKSKAKLSDEIDYLKNENKQLSTQHQLLKSEIDSFSDTLEKRRSDLEKSMQDQKDALIQEADEEVKALKEKAFSELNIIQEKISKLEENQLKEIDKSIREKQKIEKEKFDRELMHEKELIKEFKEKEVLKIKKLQTLEEEKIAARKNEYLNIITAGVLNAVNLKLKELVKKKTIAAEAKLDEIALKNLIKAALMDDHPEKNLLLSKLKSSGVKHIGKSAEQTKKIAMLISGFFILLIFGIIFKDSIASIFSSVGSAVSIEESAKDLYLKDLAEKEKNRPKFTPEMTNEYQNRYVDNIIYNTKFMEIFPSDNFQKEWVIELGNLMTQNLDLKDYNVVPYITEELKMINRLVDLRQKIRPETKEVRIAEMRIIEEKSTKILIDILGSEEKFKKLQFYTQTFFNNYRNKNIK